ncbi:MAG: hypothetical protein LBS74_10340 [Oscillospiraceae bacterium]|nr:hypothetical protein [Oscillospiraceae bacterium]
MIAAIKYLHLNPFEYPDTAPSLEEARISEPHSQAHSDRCFSKIRNIQRNIEQKAENRS